MDKKIKNDTRIPLQKKRNHRAWRYPVPPVTAESRYSQEINEPGPKIYCTPSEITTGKGTSRLLNSCSLASVVSGGIIPHYLAAPQRHSFAQASQNKRETSPPSENLLDSAYLASEEAPNSKDADRERGRRQGLEGTLSFPGLAVLMILRSRRRSVPLERETPGARYSSWCSSLRETPLETVKPQSFLQGD